MMPSTCRWHVECGHLADYGCQQLRRLTGRGHGPAKKTRTESLSCRLHLLPLLLVRPLSPNSCRIQPHSNGGSSLRPNTAVECYPIDSQDSVSNQNCGPSLELARTNKVRRSPCVCRATEELTALPLRLLQQSVVISPVAVQHNPMCRFGEK